MHRSQRIKLAAMATAGLAAVAIPGAVQAESMPEAQPRASACINNLTVHTSEDWSADGDEPYLKDLWNAPGSMDDGSTAAVNVTVAVGAIVEAWEADSTDPDDFIGSDTVGSSGGTLTFKGDDAHYSAQYSAGAC
jgi:hypothetical protein